MSITKRKKAAGADMERAGNMRAGFARPGRGSDAAGATFRSALSLVLILVTASAVFLTPLHAAGAFQTAGQTAGLPDRCRALRLVGTATAVPALERLL